MRVRNIFAERNRFSILCQLIKNPKHSKLRTISLHSRRKTHQHATETLQLRRTSEKQKQTSNELGAQLSDRRLSFQLAPPHVPPWMETNELYFTARGSETLNDWLVFTERGGFEIGMTLMVFSTQSYILYTYLWAHVWCVSYQKQQCSKSI